MHLLHIDASARFARSNSRALSAFFVDELRTLLPEPPVIDRLDLAVEAPPHVTEIQTAAMYTPAAERTPEMAASLLLSDRLCAQLLQADAIVIGTPMYNFSMPSALKAYIDNVVRLGVTFTPQPDGTYAGGLAGSRLLFITSRGGDLRPGTPLEHADALTPSLRAAFGFIGARSPQFVDAQPMQFGGPDAKEAGLARARAELTVIAREWASAARAE